MSDVKNNPFEYEAANNLPPEVISQVYIEDFNYSRFIHSQKNVFLLGERGCGKTMTLLFHSFQVQYLKNNGSKNCFDKIGVYVPCNTPLVRKPEYALLNDFQAATISEHYLVLTIIFAIADCLEVSSELKEAPELNEVAKRIEFILDIEIDMSGSLFQGLKLFAQKESMKTQKKLNRMEGDSFYEDALSFSGAVYPIISALRSIGILSQSHFLLMIDDAHDLNDDQILILNSWIAYRDHTEFSFKVATAKVKEYKFITQSGASILEGHDFILVDMEQPMQNSTSSFGKMARQIVKRRLERIGVESTAEEFFPINDQMQRDLDLCSEKVKEEAYKKFPNGTDKQIGDYVYKYYRAEYFRSRDPKANRPAYSGFDIIVHLSTGVIRNLLEPCYWMYDLTLSQSNAKGPHTGIRFIDPALQTEVICQRSERLWQRLDEGLDKVIDKCSREEAVKIKNLFEKLADHFRKRLLEHKSEPRAVSFTVSGLNEFYKSELFTLFDICRRAQYLYTRRGSGKDDGNRVTVYTPNRLLWPAKGLDPHGQHAFVSLKAKDLLAAANGTHFPAVVQADDSVEEGLLL